MAAMVISSYIMAAERREGEPIASPYISVLFAVAFAVMSLMLLLLDVKASLWWGSALALLFFLCFVHFVWIWDKTVNLRIWAKLLLVFLVGCFYFWLVGKQVIAKYREENAARQTLDQEYKKIQAQTIHDFFLNEFPKASRRRSNPIKGFVHGYEESAEAQLYRDLQENATFIGYYIPSDKKIGSDIRTEAMAEMLAPRYGEVLSFGNNVEEAISQDSQKISSKSLVFTRRVYIYHQDQFSAQEMASLQKVYEDRGLSLILRGNDYASFEITQQLTTATLTAFKPQ